MAIRNVMESGGGFVNLPESGAGFVNVPEAGYHPPPPRVKAGWVNIPEAGSTATWDPEFKELCDLGALNLSDEDDLEFLQLEIAGAQSADTYDPLDYVGCAGASNVAAMQAVLPAPGLTGLEVSAEVKSWVELLNEQVRSWFPGGEPPPDPGAPPPAAYAAAPAMNWPLALGGVAVVGVLLYAIARR